MPDISYSITNFEQVYLVGVKLWPGAHEADSYALVLYNEVARNEQNRPLTIEGRVVFFRRATAANEILLRGDAAFRKYQEVAADVTHVYDVPAVLDTLLNSERDDRGIVADFVNELLDFVDATGLAFPPDYRGRLHALADSTTFNTDLSGFPTDVRQPAVDSILWAIGAIASRSTIVT